MIIIFILDFILKKSYINLKTSVFELSLIFDWWYFQTISWFFLINHMAEGLRILSRQKEARPSTLHTLHIS